jgi:DNA-binding beta-propeller fold protein YncE
VWPHWKTSSNFRSNTKQTRFGESSRFDTANYTVIKEIIVGSLPDMVTFSPDGKYIMSANEGEPSDDYSNDPNGVYLLLR